MEPKVMSLMLSVGGGIRCAARRVRLFCDAICCCQRGLDTLQVLWSAGLVEANMRVGLG